MNSFCGQCGAKLEEGSLFCGDCGSPVEADTPSAANEPIHPQYSPPPSFVSEQSQYSQTSYGYPSAARSHYESQPAQGQSRGTRILSISLAALLVVQIAAVALFGWPGFLVNDKKDNASGTTSGESRGD